MNNESKVNMEQQVVHNPKKNYIFLLIGRLIVLVLPLISTPYIARVLTSDGTGRFSFCISIVTYFTLFASLGFNTYGQRLIAKHQNDKILQSINFWEIVIARLIPVFLSILLYVPFVLILCENVDGFSDKYKTLLIIMSINIFSIALSLDFFWLGNEEFKKNAIRSVMIQILVTVSFFLFVKNESDLYIYVIIKLGADLLNHLCLYPFLKKYLVKINIKDLHPTKHFKASLLLFLPTIAASVYTILDKTLIGFLCPNDIADYENGCYDKAEQIVKIGMTIITSIGTVMYPRNANLYSKGKIEEVKNNLYFSAKFVFLMGIPIMLGFILISENFIPLFLGESYDKAILLFKLLSPLVLIIGFSNIFGIQYLLAIGKDIKYTIPIIVGAVLNLLLNLIFISNYYSVGAVISTLSAEVIVTILMIFFSRKEINIWKIFSNSWKYLIAGLIMFFVCYFINKLWLKLPNENDEEFVKNMIYMKNCGIIAAVGIFSYFIVLLLLREQLLCSLINKFKNIIFKDKKVN